MKNYLYWLGRVFELGLLAVLTLLVIKAGFGFMSKKDTLLNIAGTFIVLFGCLSSGFYAWWVAHRILIRIEKSEKEEEGGPDKSCL